MKLTQLILIALFIPLFTSCGHKGNDSSSATTKDESAGNSRPETLPFLQSSDVNSLYSQAETSDMIFYNLPISVSQDDAASAKSTVLYIVPALPNVSSKCDPLGRVSWNSNGKIIREADFFVGEGCNYFIFMENGKPAYRNAMSPEGVRFFQTVMSQVKPPDKK